MPDEQQQVSKSKAEDFRRIKRIVDTLKSEFDKSWKPHFYDLASYMNPRKGRFLDKDTQPNMGDPRNDLITDPTAVLALRTLSAGLHSGLTPQSRPWFVLSLADKDLMEFPAVRVWLDEVQSRIRETLGQGNFYNGVNSIYSELGCFGTGSLYSEGNFFKPRTAGEYFVGVNERGEVDTHCTIEWMTALNASRKYGRENLSQRTRNMLKNNNEYGYIQVVHLVIPNTDKELGKKFSIPFNRRFLSLHFEYTQNDENFLRQSGYNTFPFQVPRWSVTGSESYGRSPGMDALPEIKMLQLQRKLWIKGVHKKVDPPMVATGALKNKHASTLPGGVTYLDPNTAGGNNKFEPAYAVDLDLGAFATEIGQTRHFINQLLYSDLFQMIQNAQQDQKTAYEVARLYEEKLIVLGPVIERIHPELLIPVITRRFNDMVISEELPPAPEELEGMPLRIELISLLAQAQKAVGLTTIDQTMGFILTSAQAKPEVLDTVDFDFAARDYIEKAGAPKKLIVPLEQVAEIRAQRQRQIEQQQQADALERMAGGAKTLSDAKLEDNNVLSTLVGAGVSQ